MLAVWLITSALVVSGTHASAEDASSVQQRYDISLAELLDENGNIELPEGFSGSIDPTGFQMVNNEGEAPRFVRSSAGSGTWSDGEFGIPGCDGTITALAVMSGELFIGGLFQACGFASVSNIARFDPGTGEFSSLGDGVSGIVNALAVINDVLYVGGNFGQAGIAPASRIAAYDTTQSGNDGWSALGDGVNGSVHALVAVGTDIYLGGEFTQAGGAPASFIAVYDTTQTGNAGWAGLGDGVNGFVRALTAISSNLYVGGQFSRAGSVAASRIAVFDTSQGGNAGWSTLGDGVNNSVLALTAIGGDLYVGGSFDQAGGTSADKIALFDTNKSGNIGWSALGDGINSPAWFDSVQTLFAVGDDLYVGGSFYQAVGADADFIAVYDTTQTGNAGWSALGDGASQTVLALASIGDELYVGGIFSQAGPQAASRIAVFDTTQTGNPGWSGLGEGINGRVNALAAIGDNLYIAGTFSQAGDVPANGIAAFDTTQAGSAGWSALGDGLSRSIVYALAVIGDDLYVGGLFSQAGGVTARNIAVFDTTQAGNAGWSPLGDGVDNTVTALATIGENLYAGGFFSHAGFISASRIAVYDTTQTGNAGWSALGAGVNNWVHTLAAVGNDLYVGGDFSSAGASSAGRIAVFDTTQTGNAGWSTLGDGVNGGVRSLAVIDDDLYVGGSFSQAGGAAANSIAAFDMTQAGNVAWSPLGDGVDNWVYALAAIGNDLYVGGSFSQAGDNPANRIAVFDTAQTGNAGWTALGDGVNSPVRAFVPNVTDLYLGGDFGTAGGSANGYLARYSPNQPPIAQPDVAAADEDTVLLGNVLSDNGNGPDDDPDGDPLTVTEVDGVAGSVGSQIALASGALLTVNASGDFTYDPNGQFETLAVGDTATDAFGYTISDGILTDSATVTVTINGANDDPAADPDAGSTAENAVLTASDLDGTATPGDPSDDGVLANDDDIDGDQLSVDQVEGSAGNVGTATTLASGAIVTVAVDGTFVYDPNGQFAGLDVGEQGGDSFSYRATDGTATATATASVDITIDGVNNPPVAANDDFATDEDVPLSGNVFADNGSGPDADPDDPLAVSNAGILTATGLGGSVDLQANGDFIYTPPADASGTDAFDYNLEDDNGATDTAAATITVNPVNDAPTFISGGDVTGFEDTPYDQPWAGAISPGPADESGQSVTFLVNPTTNPDLFQSGPAIDATGRLTFTPAPDAAGTAEVEVVAMDDGGMPNGGDDTSAPATFTVEVAKAADLSIDKTSGSFFTPPGGTLTYELVVTNAGPSDVADARIEDPEPSRLTFGNWQCAPAGLATCNAATGSGPVDVEVTIPEGDSVTVTVDAQLTDTDTIPVTNTATVTAPAGVTELAPADNADSDTDAVGMFVDSFETVEPD
mgnify:CR=1 FL=1